MQSGGAAVVEMIVLSNARTNLVNDKTRRTVIKRYGASRKMGDCGAVTQCVTYRGSSRSATDRDPGRGRIAASIIARPVPMDHTSQAAKKVESRRIACERCLIDEDPVDLQRLMWMVLLLRPGCIGLHILQDRVELPLSPLDVNVTEDGHIGVRPQFRNLATIVGIG